MRFYVNFYIPQLFTLHKIELLPKSCGPVAAGSAIHVNKVITTFFQGKDTLLQCKKLK